MYISYIGITTHVERNRGFSLIFQHLKYPLKPFDRDDLVNTYQIPIWFVLSLLRYTVMCFIFTTRTYAND